MTLLESFECGPAATNCYLLTNGNSALLIDAPKGCLEPVMETLRGKGLALTDILLTHTHWDHTADCEPLRRLTEARVVVHQADRYRLVDPMGHTIWPLPFEILPVLDVEEITGESGTVQVFGGQAHIRFIHTPGHTEGGVCFIVELEGAAYVGDTLFASSVGRVDLPGGDADTLVSSIRDRLFTLPGTTVIYPGHGPASTIDRERKHNPFVGDAVT